MGGKNGVLMVSDEKRNLHLPSVTHHSPVFIHTLAVLHFPSWYLFWLRGFLNATFDRNFSGLFWKAVIYVAASDRFVSLV